VSEEENINKSLQSRKINNRGGVGIFRRKERKKEEENEVDYWGEKKIRKELKRKGEKERKMSIKQEYKLRRRRWREASKC
jgi:hypothetical protein